MTNKFKNTDWDTEWDFSDEDIDFGEGDFQVNIDQFRGFEGKYVTDTDGFNREIDQDWVDTIIESWDCNHEE